MVSERVEWKKGAEKDKSERRYRGWYPSVALEQKNETPRSGGRKQTR